MNLQKTYDKTIKLSAEKESAFLLKNVTVKIITFTLFLIFATNCLVGCMNNSENNEPDTITTSQPEVERSKTNGFTTYEISEYGPIRLFELLEAYNFTDYSWVGNRRDYHYTSEQFSQIAELDETYLYAFYTSTTSETLNTVCQSLGYEDLEDFLLKNEFTKDGKADIGTWYKQNKIDISKIMKAEKEKLTKETE